jgi:predicted nucleic acid-binding protein
LRLVLDADVLIAALDSNDAQHTRARELFTGWHQQQLTRQISAVNLTEVLVAPAQQSDRLVVVREAIAALEVGVHQPTEAIAVDAARLRGIHPISLPDAYCLATARHIGAKLISFDAKLLRAAASEPGIAVD